jgi:hypothetical protein
MEITAFARQAFAFCLLSGRECVRAVRRTQHAVRVHREAVGVELGGAGQESGRLGGCPGALSRQRAVCADDVLDMVSGQAPERVVALLAKLGRGRFFC